MSTFNQPDLYLLRHWSNARQLEDSMKAVREKYVALFEKVLDRVQDKHPDLDCREIHLDKDGLNVGLGKKTWRPKRT